MRRKASYDQYEWFVGEIVKIARESEKESKSFHRLMDILDQEVSKLAPPGCSIFFERDYVSDHVSETYKPGWNVVKHMFGRSDIYERFGQ